MSRPCGASTAGFDTAPVWDPSHDYFTRKGIAYIGWTHSNQSISFPVNRCNPIPELPFLNSCGPLYKNLFLTDNGQAYEIGSQIANALKNGPNSPLPDEYEVERVFHAGQSQRGGSMVTYASAFHLEGVNDGYFVQAAGTARDINAGTECDDPEAAPFPDCTPELEGEQRLVRTDLPVPVYRAHTESDMPRVISGETRQEDTQTFRYYEMAGTAHVTVHKAVERFNLNNFLEDFCAEPLNTLSDGPVLGSFLYNAMWENMERQVLDGVEPPHGALMEVAGEAVARDDFGNAVGGIRLPERDGPVATWRP